MGTPYKIAFSVAVKHSYFTSGACTCLAFSATEASGKLMAKYGFLVNPLHNGFQLFTNSSQPLNDYFEYIYKTSGLHYFEFEIQNLSPSFYLYTDLPLDQNGLLSYSSHQLISQQDNVLKLRGTFEAQRARPVFGSLKVYFDSIDQLTGTEQPCELELDYTARSTSWQYYIINKSGLTLANSTITGKSDIVFEGPLVSVLQNGEEALRFSSGDHLIALHEKPLVNFDLVSKKEGNGNSGRSTSSKLIYRNLPGPSVNNLSMETVNGKTLITSSIYVYL
jgi:hypothetical protein